MLHYCQLHRKITFLWYNFYVKPTLQEPEKSTESSEQLPGNSPQASQWQRIINSLNELLNTMTENFVRNSLFFKIEVKL